MRFVRSAGTAALVLAVLPATALAQRPLQPGTVSTPVGRAAPGADGLEIGASSMVIAIFPTFGGQVSIPAGRRVRLELGAHAMPWLLEDGEDMLLLTQVQVRVPFRAGPPGSRRSLLLGVTSFTVADRLDSMDEWEFFGGVRPHAGVGWQWQKSPHIDVRIDLQGVFTGTSMPFVVPFATFSMVWHRHRPWS